MTSKEIPSTDLIRWTFTVQPGAAEAVETHLADLGADVFVRNGENFHVTWDEPEVDLDAIVEEVWSLAGEFFEITQEEFHRLELHVLQHFDGTEEVRESSAPISSGVFHPDLESLDTLDL